MNRPSSPPFLIIVLILHAGFIALALPGLMTRPDSPPERISIAVQLLPAQKQEVPAPPPSAPPVAKPSPAVSPPEQQSAKPKPVPKPRVKPAPKPRPAREPASPEAKLPATAPAPAPSSITSEGPVQPSAAPVAAAAPPGAPVAAPPAKTGVYISAEHAATNVKPVYPAMSKRYGEQGTVVLRIFVKADGTAGEVEIKSSSGYPLLDESAKITVQGWRFQPATSDGKPIGDWYLQSIPFKLEN